VSGLGAGSDEDRDLRGVRLSSAVLFVPIPKHMPPSTPPKSAVHDALMRGGCLWTSSRTPPSQPRASAPAMAWSVDRLGRSLQDLVGFLSELHALRIDLYLHQQGLDTTTPAGKAMIPDDLSPPAQSSRARRFFSSSPLQ
jgi:Resolvase, N terminal domain